MRKVSYKHKPTGLKYRFCYVAQNLIEIAAEVKYVDPIGAVATVKTGFFGEHRKQQKKCDTKNTDCGDGIKNLHLPVRFLISVNKIQRQAPAKLRGTKRQAIVFDPEQNSGWWNLHTGSNSND